MPRMTKPVIVTDQEGTDHVFPSAAGAAEYIGCSTRSVWNHISFDCQLYGYMVRYAEVEECETVPEGMICLYNNGVICDNFTMCKTCGWNPDVKEKRLTE